MVDDVDLDSGVLRVTGKGSGRGPRQRLVGYGPKTAAALDKYPPPPCASPAGGAPEPLARRHVSQPLSVSGVAQLGRERGRLAGIKDGPDSVDALGRQHHRLHPTFCDTGSPT